MKVCLIRPPMIDRRYQAVLFTAPPLGLAYLAASGRAAGHDVSVIDALGEDPERETPLDGGRFVVRGLPIGEILERVPGDTNLLGVSCMFSQDWPHLRRMIQRLREAFPGLPLVVGGEHVTALPEHVLGDAPVDHCVVGEGEETFVELLAALAEGRSFQEIPGLVTRVDGEMVYTHRRPRIRDIDEIPAPAWDLFPLENYLSRGLGIGIDRGRSMPILATRGCPYQCTFCSSPSMWTTRWLARDPARVLAEIRNYVDEYRAESFDFYDLTAIIRREWVLEFCRLVRESGLHFTWQLPSGTRSEAIDGEVAEALRETGCRNITYAPESGSVTELRRIKKKVETPRMLRSMRSCVKRGLIVKANIVVGFPGQTPRELFETLVFISKMAVIGVRDVVIMLFSAYPGSEMYRDLRLAGRVPAPSDDYFLSLTCQLDLSQAVSFTEGLSPRQLASTRILGMLLFYAVSHLLRPWRLAQTAYRLVRGRQETPLDKGLASFFKRRSWGRRAAIDGPREPSAAPSLPGTEDATESSRSGKSAPGR